VNANQAAQFLIEGDDENYDAKVFADRLLLRIYSAPSLLAYLHDIAMIKESDEGKSGVIFQIKFSKLPEETISQVKDLIGVPGIRALAFDEERKPCTGFQFFISDEQLSASKSEKQRPNTRGEGFGQTGRQQPALG